MSGDYPFTARIVSPVKCNEKPWDLWVSEIGHSSPRRDQDEETRVKPGRARYRRAGINRLRHNTMNLHGLFPQADNLNAAVCHMCGVTVKCSAAYRHLLDSHACSDPILPPPPPTVKLKSHSRSRHKKELLPPPPIEMLPVKLESSPLLTATTPLSRLVAPPPDPVPYLDEASTSAAVTGEVQIHVASGELPVVSIQDTEDLPLGENITDDIFAIMNSEGIQTADDIANSTDWKNIIRDINMQDLHFSQPSDTGPSQDLYPTVDPSALAYTLSDSDISSLQLAANSSPLLTNVIESTPQTLNAQVTKPAPVVAPPTKSQSRSKSSKTKFNLREYDPNKHCGVVTADNNKPCTRSLTCKVHALSLRRLVEGRIKPFDMLLAEHRASKDPANNVNAVTTAHTTPNVELSSINGLITDSQVSDLYATLLGVEEPVTQLPIPEPTVINIPVVPAPVLEPPIQERREEAPPVVPNDVCWYTSSPRPLALCTFNTSHAGGAITLGKKFATVRSNIKSSLSRSQKSTAGSSSSFLFGQSPVSWNKSLHMNNVRQKPEVRRVVVRCAATSGRGAVETGRDVRLNGHVAAVLKARPLLDLGFGLDPLLADDKC